MEDGWKPCNLDQHYYPHISDGGTQAEREHPKLMADLNQGLPDLATQTTSHYAKSMFAGGRQRRQMQSSTIQLEVATTLFCKHCTK